MRIRFREAKSGFVVRTINSPLSAAIFPVDPFVRGPNYSTSWTLPQDTANAAKCLFSLFTICACKP